MSNRVQNEGDFVVRLGFLVRSPEERSPFEAWQLRWAESEEFLGESSPGVVILLALGRFVRLLARGAF